MAHRIGAGSFLLIILWSSVVPAVSAERTVRYYALPDHGDLALSVPDAWIDNLHQPPERLPSTITFKEISGAPFEVLVTPIWAAPGHAPLTPEAAQEIVRAGAKKAEEQAIEKNIKIRSLAGGAGPGFYFQATDKAPAPGEYRFMTQGAMVLGDLVVTFTALTNDGEADIVAAALAMVASAKHRR